MAQFSERFHIRPWEWGSLVYEEALALIDVIEQREA